MNYDGMVSRIQEILRALPNMQATPAQLEKSKADFSAIMEVIEMKVLLINAANSKAAKGV